jgi:hypothetical protein
MPLFEKLGIDPKPHIGVAGGGHFGKDHSGLVLTIQDPKMSPAKGSFGCRPLRAQ